MKRIVFVGLALVLAACSSQGEHTAESPTTITLSLVGDNGMNPNVFGESAAVELQVFELQDDSMFMYAGFDEIKADVKKALKHNLVNVYDYMLQPGQFKFVEPIEIDEDTQYIGVMARFAEPELSEWKRAVKVINTGRQYHLLVYLKDYDVMLEKVE
ncbi:type VI secretion system lipoprotein TssJ (plasmid) [Vibrio alginolyticus]